MPVGKRATPDQTLNLARASDFRFLGGIGLLIPNLESMLDALQ
jgi:hypothetical protein